MAHRRDPYANRHEGIYRLHTCLSPFDQLFACGGQAIWLSIRGCPHPQVSRPAWTRIRRPSCGGADELEEMEGVRRWRGGPRGLGDPDGPRQGYHDSPAVRYRTTACPDWLSGEWQPIKA